MSRVYQHKEPVGVAVIGTGRRMAVIVNMLMARHGPLPSENGISDHGLIKIVAFCDESTQAIKMVKNELSAWTKVSYHEVPEFNSTEDMFASQGQNFSWVLIGSKNSLHRDHCVISFQNGKHVFCEKPLATTIDECEDIQNAHKKSGKLFMTGFVLRHAEFYCKIHEMLNNGLLGQIVSVQASETLIPSHGSYIMRNWRRHRSETGPHILEKCCHDIDILNWLMGTVPSRVASFGGLNIFLPENKPKSQEVLSQYFHWPSWENVDPFDSVKDTEDNQVAILEYRNNVRATFHTNCNTPLPKRSIEIIGLKGTLRGDVLKGKIKYKLIGSGEEVHLIETKKGMDGGADLIIIQSIAECIDKECQPKTGGEEGFRSAVVCLGIDEARLKSQVIDLEPIWKKFGV